MADLIIHEIYAAGSPPGGQQSGVPTYRYDYVVLHNTTANAIDLTNYALQTINGTGTGTWSVLNLTGGSVPAFGYFLIQLGTTASTLGGAALPVTADATAADAMALGPNSAKLALTNTTTALTGATSTGAAIIDMVGFGGQANAREGTSPANNAPSPTNTTAIVRNATDGWDTNVNSADFATATPNPKNSSSAPFNASPSITSSATATFAENGTGTVLDVNATDPEGNTENGGGLTYSIVANANDDSSLFTIDSATGALSFVTRPFVESGTGHGATLNDYILTVQVLDNGGALAALATQNVTITVTDINVPPVFTSSATATFAENGTGTVLDVNATDHEGNTENGGGLTYSIVANANDDSALFAIDAATGALSFITPPNAEAGSGHGATVNDYVLRVQVLDNGAPAAASSTQDITVSVTNINETPTIVSSAAVTVAENTSGTVLDVNATDPEGNTENGGGLTYSIVANANDDSALFAIDAATGALSFITPPNAEAGSGHGATVNDYVLRVQVLDNGAPVAASSTQDVTISVADVNEAPVFTSSANVTFAENGTGEVLNVSATDAEGSTENGGGLTYSIVTNANDDSALFTIDPDTGALSFNTPPNAEAGRGHGATVNNYVLRVQVLDNGAPVPASSAQDVTISVTDVNEFAVTSPVDRNSTPNVRYENTVGSMGLTVSATDRDHTNNTIRYSLVTDLTGTKAYSGPFAINAVSGAVSLTKALDYESGGPTYKVYVKAASSDGSSAVSQFTLNIANVSPETKIGTSANNTLTGGSDKDILRGLAGNDILNGLAGNDTLAGGFGKDVMTGGSGLDRFDFDSIGEAGRGATRDRITDFQHLADKIDLSGIDAKTGVDKDQAFTFLATMGTAFTGVKGQLHWYQINVTDPAGDKTIIEGDINGDKVADFQIELANLKVLTAGDFVL